MIARAIYHLLGGVQGLVRAVDWVRRAVKGRLPVDETPPMPLTHRDVRHIQEQQRRAARQHN